MIPYTTYLRISFLISLAAVFGSLYFSEILGYPPCVLCWYQRICIYPLVLIFSVGLLQDDRSCLRYAWPLIGIGLVISIYHNLLYYGVIPAAITPCTQGVSCTTRQVEYLGFITIPLLSFLGFIALVVLNFLTSKSWSLHEKK